MTVVVATPRVHIDHGASGVSRAETSDDRGAPGVLCRRDEVCHNLFALVPCQELRYPLCLPPPGMPDTVLPVD